MNAKKVFYAFCYIPFCFPHLHFDLVEFSATKFFSWRNFQWSVCVIRAFNFGPVWNLEKFITEHLLVHLYCFFFILTCAQYQTHIKFLLQLILCSLWLRDDCLIFSSVLLIVRLNLFSWFLISLKSKWFHFNFYT